jgi:hypothetical protein
VVGDSITTAVGLSAGAAESNPLAATVLEVAGRPGMVVLEGAIVIALSLCDLGFDRATPSDNDDEAAPFVAGLGVLVTAWNLVVIALQ